MGIFDKLLRRGHHDDFHEAMLAAEREAEPLRRWLVQEVDAALDAGDSSSQGALADSLVAKVRDERVSLEAMQVLQGSPAGEPVILGAVPSERDILAGHMVAGAFAKLQGPYRPAWWTKPEERARRGF